MDFHEAVYLFITIIVTYVSFVEVVENFIVFLRRDREVQQEQLFRFISITTLFCLVYVYYYMLWNFLP